MEWWVFCVWKSVENFSQHCNLYMSFINTAKWKGKVSKGRLSSVEMLV
jgi:hypothetical protein